MFSAGARPIDRSKAVTNYEEPKTIIYSDDFERFTTSSTQDQVYLDSMFSMMDAGNVTIVEHNGSKAIKYTKVSTDCVGYIGAGACGDSLAKLELSKLYRFSFNLEIDMSAGSSLWIEYPGSHHWTNVWFDSSNVIHTDNKDATFNISFSNGVCSFFANGQTAPTNMKLTFYPSAAGDNFIMDNFVIEEVDSMLNYSNFNNNNVGDAALATSSAIANVWNGGADYTNVAIAQDAITGKKYLNVTDTATGDYRWPLFYFNNLTTMQVGHRYRFDINMPQSNFVEMYIYVPGNWGSYTYITITSAGAVTYAATNNEWQENASFVDGRLIIDVKATEALNQVLIIFKALQNEALNVRIDEFAFYDLDLLDAKKYANELLDKTSVCDATGAVNNITSAIWEELSDDYAALESTAKAAFLSYTADQNSVYAISRALARYSFIAHKYNTLNNFLGIDLGAGSNSFNILPVKSETLIVIIASASMFIFALGFMLLKRKRA